MATEATHVLPKWAVQKARYKEHDALASERGWKQAARLFKYTMTITVAGLFALGLVARSSGSYIPKAQPCDSVQSGYQCSPDISHYWGQYSPYFSVPSEISANVPASCSVTFAQILSRHGARDPTASKTKVYNNTIAKIKSNVASSAFEGDYAFLDSYEYTLGADQLTVFGQQEMINSGIKFFDRYESLARKAVPFVRSSSEARVVESAQNWTQGFTQTKSADRKANKAYPSINVIISEDTGSNNTLNHDLCTSFEDGPDSSIAAAAQSTWANVFVPAIQTRLNTNLPGANLSQTEVIYLMDLCPFNTVASTNGTISPFCSLFTEAEWHDYGYYESLNKFYGYGAGNPLGPTQGVGFTNELIARLTKKAVVDNTSTNHTLDSNPDTFPLDRALYADFSHDNDMTAIAFALGLYNSTSLLSNTTLETTQQTNGYSASYTVPFAARFYIEKLQCAGHKQEMVRVLVNDRVLPLKTCGADALGRCSLDKFVDSLSFAESDGGWNQCFI